MCGYRCNAAGLMLLENVQYMEDFIDAIDTSILREGTSSCPVTMDSDLISALCCTDWSRCTTIWSRNLSASEAYCRWRTVRRLELVLSRLMSGAMAAAVSVACPKRVL